MAFYSLSGNSQTKNRTTSFFLTGLGYVVERFENLWQIFFGNTRFSIRDVDLAFFPDFPPKISKEEVAGAYVELTLHDQTFEDKEEKETDTINGRLYYWFVF